MLLLFVYLGHYNMKKLPVLNINQFKNQEELTDFYSNDLNVHLKQNSKIVHKPHSHNFYLCVCFTEGNGTHEIDFDSYTISKGSVFFLRPGQMHRWHFTSLVNGFIFFHTQEFFQLNIINTNLNEFPFYFSLENTPKLQLNDFQLNKTGAIFQSINDEFNGQMFFKTEKIATLINLVYIDLSRLYSEKDSKTINVSSSYLNILRILEQKIELHFKTEKTVQFYANLLNITPKHLNRVVKSTIDKTTSEFITNRVLLEAKRLIVHSKNPLSHTAETLGFYDYAHFSKLFKSKIGMTAIEFKTKHRL